MRATLTYANIYIDSETPLGGWIGAASQGWTYRLRSAISKESTFSSWISSTRYTRRCLCTFLLFSRHLCPVPGRIDNAAALYLVGNMSTWSASDSLSNHDPYFAPISIAPQIHTRRPLAATLCPCSRSRRISGHPVSVAVSPRVSEELQIAGIKKAAPGVTQTRLRKGTASC